MACRRLAEPVPPVDSARVSVAGSTGGRNDGLIWPHCDGLNWPHLVRSSADAPVLIERRFGGWREVGYRVEQFEQIRRDREREGLSLRALAERHGVHRRTVRAALESPLPPPRRVAVSRPAPKLGAYRELIDGWLMADVDAPRKQRHTSKWFASDSTPQIRGLIRPHLAGSTARRGGAGNDRARSVQRGSSS